MPELNFALRCGALAVLMALTCAYLPATAQAGGEVTIYVPAANPNAVEQSSAIETSANLQWTREIFSAAQLLWRAQFEPMLRVYESTRAHANACTVGVTRKIAAQENLNWVGIYRTARWSVLARPGLEVRLAQLAEAKGLRVGVIANSPGAKLAAEAGLTVDAVARPEQNYEKLLNGRIDLWLSNERSQQMILTQNKAPAFHVAYLSPPEEFGLVCSPNTEPEILARLSRVLKDLSQRTD